MHDLCYEWLAAVEVEKKTFYRQEKELLRLEKFISCDKLEKGKKLWMQGKSGTRSIFMLVFGETCTY